MQVAIGNIDQCYTLFLLITFLLKTPLIAKIICKGNLLKMLLCCSVNAIK